MTILTRLLKRRQYAKTISHSGAFDAEFYFLQAKEIGLDVKDPLNHYLKEGHKIGLKPHRLFDGADYLRRYPDIEASGIDPFFHFLKYGAREKRNFSNLIAVDAYAAAHDDFDPVNDNILSHYNRTYASKSGSAEAFAIGRQSIHAAMESGLFDYNWYCTRYKKKFEDATSAFAHYQRVSCFSPVNPSEKFDSIGYYRQNIDVFHSQVSPLKHYLDFGRFEGRKCMPAGPTVTPPPIEVPRDLTEKASRLKVAFCFHIFYEDYIETFIAALEKFPVAFDIYVAAASEEISAAARSKFSALVNAQRVESRVVPNRGRNFGPLLVEFGTELKRYDLACHLHSKKSLYSGREQTQWARYLIEYMVQDTEVVTRALNAFAECESVGIYYPTTFWLMPSWVNHVLSNRQAMKYWSDKYKFEVNQDFLSYPVGGMMWFRPSAIEDLLNENFAYEDFPSEPLPNDGSMLHGLERVVGLIAEKNGYRQLFYYPETADLSYDKSFMFRYYLEALPDLIGQLRHVSHISFDIFDTLVQRKFVAPDYAKYKLGKDLAYRGLVNSATEFVELRNDSESYIRHQRNFLGDVSIIDIYQEVAERLNLSFDDGQKLMKQEFDLDFGMMSAKSEFVDFCNEMIALGKSVWIISDTYYTKEQIQLILAKIGISDEHCLFVSNDLGLRKDNASMWMHIKAKLDAEGNADYIHVGDNVVADAQLPGDLGLRSFHILHPLDKWQALGFPNVMGHGKLDEEIVLKWGQLISRVGRLPWIG